MIGYTRTMTPRQRRAKGSGSLHLRRDGMWIASVTSYAHVAKKHRGEVSS